MSSERSGQMQDVTELIFNTANKLQTISRISTTAQPEILHYNI